MINLISNNCTSTIIYKRLNIPYDNPFMSCQMLYPSVYNLVKYYDKINYKNYSIYESNYYDRDHTRNTYAIGIDNKLILYFIHHLSGNNKRSYRTLWIPNVKEYLEDKYLSRVARMNNDPLFIISGINAVELSTNELSELASITTHKMVIITKDPIKNNNKLVEVIKLPRMNIETEYSALQTIKNSKFLKERLNRGNDESLSSCMCKT